MSYLTPWTRAVVATRVQRVHASTRVGFLMADKRQPSSDPVPISGAGGEHGDRQPAVEIEVVIEHAPDGVTAGAQANSLRPVGIDARLFRRERHALPDVF